jgi:autotransporter-associated beta strand protein
MKLHPNRLLILAAGYAVSTATVTAQTNHYWAGSGANNAIGGTPDNWFNAATGGTSVTPTSGDANIFNFGTRTAALTTANNATGGFNLRSIVFNSGASDLYSFTVSGLQMEWKTLSSNITQNSIQNHTVSVPIKLAERMELTGTGTGIVTVSGLWEGGGKTIIKNGTSAFHITGNASSAGAISINAGTIAYSGSGSLGVIQLRGGVIATSGTFSRALGTTATSVNFAAATDGGFAAYGGNLTVSTNLGTWGTTANSLTATSSLILGSSIANGVVTLDQNLGLGTATRTIQLVDNDNSTADFSRISGIISGTGGLNITGAGTLQLSGNNSYTGGTLVGANTTLVVPGTGTLTSGVTVLNNGRLIANGSITQAVTVEAGGSLGGTGTISANVTFNSSSNFVFNPTGSLKLTAGSVVNFSNFGVNNLVGVDWLTVNDGIYQLITGTDNINFAGLQNFGAANAYDLGNDRLAYFQQGSLELVVTTIPESSSLLLVGMTSLGLLRRRRLA